MKRKGEVIQSGHFMISSVTEENDDNLEDFRDGRDSPVLHEERLKLKMMYEEARNNYRYPPNSKAHVPVAIDGSLSRLFTCMSLAYEDGRLVSPKWKNFKGLKLSVKDKIRLNNAIWRTWYIQYVKQNKPLIQFATPFENETGEDSHTRPEAVIMEGKYWKRRIETVVAEYKKWRAFYTDNVRDTSTTSHHHTTNNQHTSMDDTMVTVHREMDQMFSQGDQETYSDLTNDTLFSCLSQPFHFPDPREMRATNSDMIQPGLLQFQPSFDDFTDLQLEPIQSTASDWMNPPAKKMAVMSGHHHHQHRQTMDDLSLNQSFNTELFTSSVMNQPMTSSTQVKKHHVRSHVSSQPNDPLLSSIHNNTTAPQQQQQQTFKQPALQQPQKSSNPMLGASAGGAQQQQKMVTTLTRAWVPDSNEFIPIQQQANQQEMVYYDSSGAQAMSSGQQAQQPVKVMTGRNIVVYKPHQQQVHGKSNSVVQWQKLPQNQFGDQQVPADMRVVAPLPPTSTCTNHHDRGKMTRIKQLLTQQQQSQQQQQQPKITIMEVATTNNNCDETRRRKHSSNKQQQQNYVKHPNSSMTSPHMTSPTLMSGDMDVSSVGRGGASPSGSVSNESTCSSSKQRSSGSFSTEQKRRFNIKVAFARLQSLIPGLTSPTAGAVPPSPSSSSSAASSNKPLTKAATMGKANAYIKLMQADKQKMDDELGVLRGEVNKLKEAIGLIQQQLPETGSSPNVSQPRSEDVTRRFNAWIKQRALANWKFYLFGPVIRPWFDSYHQSVANSSNQTFTACVDEWVTTKCSLPQLRASIINSLQKLSVNTAILTDPHQLQENISELISSDDDITS